MNPLHWEREHQIAFFVAAVFGAALGSFIGLRQVEPSTSLYWLHVGSWSVAGTVLAAAGAFIRQVLRDRKSN